ncbi:LD-carboxypeptidase [Exiguobacterium flavidum]|uniref:LD-carboxypeptidase n=1 Tax=Exiguobacterium flavidum TaxID=2184695 RepID=UPI000DF73DB9|nr:LD-carboxypeptidase [Exiguobacterium flavidum]
MLDHVQLAAPAGSEEKCLRFYRDLLGLKEIRKPDSLSSNGGVWFDSGTTSLHIGIEEGFSPQSKAHPAFTVPDLDLIAGRLADSGHAVMFDERLAPIRRLYTKDPFGNRIELIEAQLKALHPDRLKPGDHIRLLAPASSLSLVEEQVVSEGIHALERLGFHVSISCHARKKNVLGSSDVAHRVSDLHQAFGDQSVQGIMAVRGGFNSNELLPHLDYELIRSNPKVLIGFSDITALANAIFKKTGLVTYSGPMLRGIGMNHAYTKKHFIKALMESADFEIETSANWFDDGITRPNQGPVVLQHGEADGRIVGGNLCTLNLLQGTAFMPDLRGAVLFLEDDYEVHPATVARDFHSLMQQPGAEQIAAIVFGRFQAASGLELEQLRYMISYYPSLSGVPVIANLDFGHTLPMFTFPIGGTASVSTEPPLLKIHSS